MTTAQQDKSYSPARSEPEIRARWDAARAFHAVPSSGGPGAPGEPYCILIPPPNVTAALHLGHAFNNTLQDVLVRYHRMRGDSTLWMPGTDHAGIATQAVVEKRLLLQGKRRTDFTREQFIAIVQEWKDEYEATIIEQLKAMGCSCDFQRTRFTMDEVCTRAVREAFFRLFKDGLIYRGKRLVNWDPASQTALADDEVEMEEVQGHMYYLRYPVVSEPSPAGRGQGEGGPARSQTPSPPTPLPEGEGDYITVATTRPETMLGDTAVAINPRDPRAGRYVGKKVRLPIVNRVIPIIADDYVVMPGGDDPKAAFATGFLKVTPAHDENDYQIRVRHPEIEMINVLAPDATISDKHGWTDVSDEARPLLGLSREDAREKVVAWFKSHGLLEDRKPYTHSVGHSYRSQVPIEPYLSDQWYVKVTDDTMRGAALRAMSDDQREGPSNSGLGVSPKPDPSKTSTKGVSSVRVSDRLTIHQGNLPHWQLGGHTYFVTFRLAQGELSPDERGIVLKSCLHWHGDRLHAHLVTVMPDHVHLIIKPLMKDPDSWHSLSDLLHSIKSFSSHEIQLKRGASGQLWQEEYFDRIIRNDDEFLEKWNYMVMNPVEAGLVKDPEKYPFTARGLGVEPGLGETPKPLDLGDGGLRFYPARYAKTFESWHENLRDWCISRQLWWGHRIPVWTYAPLKPFKNFGGAIDHAEQLRGLESDLKAWESQGRITYVRQQQLGMESVAIERRHTLDTWYVCLRSDETEVVRSLEAAGFVQDPDVLDTWFSSALWPISTMGWPNPGDFPKEIPEGDALLNTFNPSSVLMTAREIITLWVSRMVMFNRYFRDGTLPFRHVYIHAMIQDGHGQKMSKSLGNGVDPRDIIHSHGADAMRFVMTQMATGTQDARMPVDMVCPHAGCEHAFEPKQVTSPAGYRVADAVQICPKCHRKMVSGYGAASGLATPTNDVPLARNTSTKFDLGRNFANKLWNATGFAMGSVAPPLPEGEGRGEGVQGLQRRTNEPSPPSPLPRGEGGRSLVDRWIISRLHRTLHTVEDALADYQFNVYAEAMYDFVWRDFCDWYIEAIKPTVKTSPAQQQVLRTVLNAILRLLHPIMPFVTESLWSRVTQSGAAGLDGINLPASDLLATAPWPDIDCSIEDPAAAAAFERVQNLVNAIRNLRGERNVQPKRKITLLATPSVMSLVREAGGVVEAIAGLGEMSIATDRPQGAIALSFEGEELWLAGLVDSIDPAAERSRLAKIIEDKQKVTDSLSAKLANPGYVNKAPAKVVDETRSKLAEAEAELAAARKALQSVDR